MTINDNTDGKIYHYNALGNLVVTKCGYACYYEYGTTAYAKVTEGKVVAKEGGEIYVLFATADNKAAALEDGGKIGVAYCAGTVADYDSFSDSKSGNVNFETVVDEAAASNKANEKVIEEKQKACAHESWALPSAEGVALVKTCDGCGKIVALTDEEIDSCGYDVMIGSVAYKTIEGAIEAAGYNETTIKLINDCVCTGTAIYEKSSSTLTIDLNGHTLDMDTWQNLIYINSGTVKLIDSVGSGRIVGGGDIFLVSNKCEGYFVAEGIDISSYTCASLVSRAGRKSSGNFTFINVTSDKDFNFQNNAIVTFKDCNISGKITSAGSSSGSITINGGTYKDFEVFNNNTLTIDSGNITGSITLGGYSASVIAEGYTKTAIDTNGDGFNETLTVTKNAE